MWYRLASSVIKTNDVTKAIMSVLHDCFETIYKMHGYDIHQNFLKANELDRRIEDLEASGKDSRLINKLSEDAEMYEFDVVDILQEDDVQEVLSLSKQKCDSILKSMCGEEYNFALETTSSHHAIGTYDENTKTLTMSPYDIFRSIRNDDGTLNYQRISGFVGHEMAHLFQFKYNPHSAKKKTDTYLRGVSNIDHRGPDAYANARETLYVNFPLERQAFLNNIINELSHLRPLLNGRESFLDFLNQSNEWRRLSTTLYPENRASMISALYKYYARNTQNAEPQFQVEPNDQAPI